MDVIVSSPGLELSPAVKAMAVEKVGKLGRYLDGMDRAEVHFSEEHNQRIADKEICEITMLGHGRHVRARVHAADQFTAIDKACDKLVNQLQRLKTRLVDRQHGNGRSPRLETPTTAAPAANVLPEADTKGVPAFGQTIVVDADSNEPRVVKMKRFHMKPMSLEEAILQMQLLDHPFFFFVHQETAEPAVVYKRRDGNIGLIEVET